MTDSDPTLAELAERVSRIEQRLADAPGAAGAAGSADRFWALQELKRREARPSVLFAGLVDTAAGPVEWQMGYDSAGLLEEDWKARAAAMAALGHPSRLQILQLVARGTCHTAAELSQAEGLGTSGQIYHHLRQLASAGWLTSTTKGRYQVPPERVVPLLVILGASR